VGTESVEMQKIVLPHQHGLGEVFPEPSDAGLSANKAVAKWNGTSWSVVAVTSTIGEGGLKKMAFAHAELYGSGSLYEAADPVHQLNFGRLNPPK
jgi:hypothetical protein